MHRQKVIIKTSLIGIVVNLMLVAVKTVAGIFANSLAIILEAVNNLTDAISSILTIVGTKLASRKPDREHPYGHGRIEYITTLAIGIIILVTGVTALAESIQKIFIPNDVNYSVASIIIMLAAIIAKMILGLYYKKIAKIVDSDSLLGSGIDAISDALLSFATLFGIIMHMLTGANLEGALGTIISVFIIKSSVGILRESWRDLIGRRPDNKLSIDIKKRILEFESVSGAYDLAIHNYGPSHLIGTVHIQIPDNMHASEIDSLTREISDAIYEEFHVILTVGIYAENTGNKKHREIHAEIEKIIEKHPEISQMHGFFVDDKHKIISFDVIFDYEYPHKTTIKNKIAHQIHKLYPKYLVDITIDVDVSD